MRPSDAWGLNSKAPALTALPDEIRHTSSRLSLATDSSEASSLQQGRFEEVQLGMHLCGSSSGVVYRGTWRGLPVAVKVGMCSPD